MSSVDRISQLSDDMVLRILSSLSTADAVQMSSLSRRWRRKWQSLPSLDFDERCGMRSFCLFVDQCLSLREKDMILATGETPIKKFRLAINPSWASVIARCLALVSYSSVEDLELHFYLPTEPSPSAFYPVRGHVLPTRSLTRLTLTNADLEDLHWVSFPVLKSMSLAGVKLEDLVLSQTLLGCPNLEKLSLARCIGLFSPEFSTPSLRFLEIDCTVGPRADVAAMNLESFVYNGPQTLGVPESLSFLDVSVRNIRSLSFHDVAWKEDPFGGMGSLFPCLESLTLHCSLRSFEIQSDSLKHCIFSTVREKAELKIEAPSLVYLRVKGCRIELSLKARNVTKTDAEFRETEYDLEWYTGLIRFLQQIDYCSTKVNLRVHSNQALVIPREVRLGFTAPICTAEDITVDVDEQSTSELEDALRWLTGKLA